MSSVSADLHSEAIEVLQRLIRFNTVNPPGNERPAIEYLEAYLRDAGFDTELLAAVPERPNLIATLAAEDRGAAADGPVMVYLAHVDTVLAAADEWTHGPWSGDVVDGVLWGRGALDMKSQVAAEAVAGASLARTGWRPARGALKLVFVSDEETGGDVGARWLTEQHPDRVRCDMLLNEGAGGIFEFGGARHYGVCCGEKGIFRLKLTAHGAAGHASLPRTGDNALLKLAPVLARIAEHQPRYDLTEAPRLLLAALGFDPEDPTGAVEQIGATDPRLRILLEPMLGVTLTPTMAHASDKINVIPSRAYLKVDCRVPPGLGETVATARLHEVLGEVADGLQIEYTEQVMGHVSRADSTLMDAIQRWIARTDPGADGVPVLLPGYSDSSWFRAAFPELIAYGFFPQRHQPLIESAPLVHSANERIDVRDLGLATGFYSGLAGELLG
jgi:acetylornithine deacetylase/succinyl-diaminopimelate desuccinylase-like protein